ATEALGIDVDRIISFGGGALSDVWCQIRADATGKEVVTTRSNKNACCLGAGILAGVACGIWTSVDEACEMIVKEDKVYKPDSDKKEVYRELLEKYKLLMKCLEPVFDGAK
ncbi:MAG: FGGY-family carbohydrate kinase, partial [Lentihominibacter sp.]|nr:FGGY-family carbohydrate kinase [Lentihominibacter sp.]